MANYKANPDIIKQLTTTDKSVLSAVYAHRCLDEALLYRFFYEKDDIKRSYTTDRIKTLISYRLIEEMDYGKEIPALFLTTAGIKTLEVLREEPCLNASELKLNRKNINHQIRLNSFALEVESYAKKRGFFQYYDGKFMPPASASLMPDGIIELRDYFLFLEMDMGTEYANRLEQKWNSYRSFLNYPSDFYSKKPVIVLFILEGVKRVESRYNTVAASLFRHIGDRFNGDFEIYIDKSETLHEIIKTSLFQEDTELSRQKEAVYCDLRKNHGLALSKPQLFQELKLNFGAYIRKIGAGKKIVMIGNRPQEFLFDIWLDGRLSVLHNLLYFNHISTCIRSKTGRSLPYLVVVPSEKWIHNILKAVNLIQPANIYFTTPTRLAASNWSEALFIIDQLNNLLHYKDASLQNTIYERRVK